MQKKNEIVFNQNKNSVLYYGADPTGKQDASQAFESALATKGHEVIVPEGTYIIDKTIEIKKHLRLGPNVKIIRTMSGSDGPIFWLSKSYATLEGSSKNVEVLSKKPLKEGIIKIGHRDKNVKKKNILFTEIKNLTISGPKGNNDESSIGVKLFNAQNKGDGTTTSYFHSLHNLIIQHVSYGVVLEGMSNANSLSNIIFNRVGSRPNQAAIVLTGAMENRIYDIFHHYSRNATTLVLDSFTDTNGALIVPTYNYVFGVIAEQGGAQAICADIRSGKYNQIGVLCNTEKGNKYFEEFEMRNNKRLID